MDMKSTVMDIQCESRIRISKFYEYSEILETRSIAKLLRKEPFSPRVELLRDGAEIEEYNFDEEHLVAFLGLLRQFVTRREFFYYRKLEKSAIRLFGHAPELTNFCNELDSSLHKKRILKGIRFLDASDNDLLGAFNAIEVISAFLYLGPLHSERKALPLSPLELHFEADAHVRAVIKMDALRISAGLLLAIHKVKKLLKNIDK